MTGRQVVLQVIWAVGIAMAAYASMDMRNRWWIGTVSWVICYTIFKRWGVEPPSYEPPAGESSPRER